MSGEWSVSLLRHYSPGESVRAHDGHHSDAVTLLGGDALELEGEHLVSGVSRVRGVSGVSGVRG